MVRAQVDHLVDRPQVQARRRAQPSGTNSPSSSHPRLKHRARCVIFFRARHAAARVAPDRGPGRLHREAAGERPPRARPQRRGSPGPIPNPAVKPAFAESTAARGCGRAGRRARGGRFSFRAARGPQGDVAPAGLFAFRGGLGVACGVTSSAGVLSRRGVPCWAGSARSMRRRFCVGPLAGFLASTGA